MARFTCSAQLFRRLKIQRSSMGASTVSGSGHPAGTPPGFRAPTAPRRERSMFRNRNRAAFQILLAKARELSMRSSVSTMSVPGAAPLQQRHAHGVGAVLLGDHQRIDDVALRLRHLLPLGVAHQAVDVDLAERHVAHEFDAQHDHARHPEEQDVEAGDEQRRGVESRQVLGLVGPAQRGERPQAGAEPGVEHVGVLRQVAPIRSAGTPPALRAPPRFRGTPRSATPECGGPTRAGARCTSRGCCTSTRSRS